MNSNESFARTALASARAGQPFNLLMGTHQFLMTPPLMAFYAALDNVGSTDAGVYVDTLTQDPNFAFSVTGVGAPNDANCNITDPLIFNANNTSATTHGGTLTGNLFRLLMGGGLTFVGAAGPCHIGVDGTSVFDSNDYATWKLVTIRQPGPNEAVTPFYDIDALRQTDTLVLRLPRVGFFTTPAFLAQWISNLSNQARVTINQTMIAALNRAFDGLSIRPCLCISMLWPGAACTWSPSTNTWPAAMLLGWDACTAIWAWKWAWFCTA